MRDASRVRLSKVVVSGTDVGGASACIACPRGFMSSGGVEKCTACPVGHYTPEEGSENCISCPINTASNETGSAECKKCGHGTTTVSGSQTCSDNNCRFRDSLDNDYDFKGLMKEGKKRPTLFLPLDINSLIFIDRMYGPIIDTERDNLAYYINICSMEHSNTSCFDPETGEGMFTYACEVVSGSDIGKAMNLGDTVGYYEYRNGTDFGVTIEYTHGTPGCSTDQLPAVERSINITLICDSMAGKVFYALLKIDVFLFREIGVLEGGNPIHKGGNTWEDWQTSPERCKYQFVWRSVYGCPLCSAKHYRSFYGACQDGHRTVSFDWIENPKPCHGGVRLPQTLRSPCNSSIVCEDGEFLTEGDVCQKCPAHHIRYIPF